MLMDGGVTNNFPVDVAKRRYPKTEIIGIALNRFREHQKISNVLDALSIAFEILLRKNTVEHITMVEHPFYINVPLKVLDTDKQKMKKAYEAGYSECMEHFT
jgi:predicted acylesterase/phospholipase RssA